LFPFGGGGSRVVWHPTVNGLPMPELLVALLRQGQWLHPGDARLRRMIPLLVDPVDFLTSPEVMARESSGQLADDPGLAAVFHMFRGSRAAEPAELPWLDVERSFFEAVNRWPGDDVGIALDYHSGIDDPRVVAGDWGSGRGACGARSPQRSAGSCGCWGRAAQTPNLALHLTRRACRLSGVHSSLRPPGR
jgi:hypothetical protein